MNRLKQSANFWANVSNPETRSNTTAQVPINALVFTDAVSLGRKVGYSLKRISPLCPDYVGNDGFSVLLQFQQTVVPSFRRAVGEFPTNQTTPM
jgi:hypothetical protein